MIIWDRIVFVLIGAAVAWVFQQYRLARSEDVALVNEHIKDIERFSDSAQAYWLKKPADTDEELQLAARVRAHHAAMVLLYGRIQGICSEQGSVQYVRLSKDLYRTATGDGFESASRGLEPSKAIDVGSLSAELVHCLRLQRADIISLRRVWLAAVSIRKSAYAKLQSLRRPRDGDDDH